MSEPLSPVNDDQYADDQRDAWAKKAFFCALLSVPLLPLHFCAIYFAYHAFTRPGRFTLVGRFIVAVACVLILMPYLVLWDLMELRRLFNPTHYTEFAS